MQEKHIKRNRSLRTGIKNTAPIEIEISMIDIEKQIENRRLRSGMNNNIQITEIPIIPIGEYFFAKYKGNLGVFIKKTNGIFICENWEGSFEENELDFIEIIEKPKQ